MSVLSTGQRRSLPGIFRAAVREMTSGEPGPNAEIWLTLGGELEDLISQPSGWRLRLAARKAAKRL